MGEIVSLMIVKCHKRGEIWTPHLVKKLPNLYALKKVTIIGTYSYTMHSSRRILVKNELIQLD